MSGHNKWSKIHRKKEVKDSRRSAEFGKVARAITLAARGGADPSMNSELKNAIDKAKSISMPSDNIKRAIERGSGESGGAKLEAVVYEFYGPGGVGIIADTITDNRNRTVSELKKLASDIGIKLADPGSVTWAFQKTSSGWVANTKIPLNMDDSEKLRLVIGSLMEHGDVNGVFTNLEQ